MKYRVFALDSTQVAQQYISFLLLEAVTFTVTPKVDRIEVTTPVDIKPHQFPKKEWLKQ